MNRIVILTTTRAEYGLLKPIMVKLANDSEIDLRVVVSGMHLSPEFGMTVKEVEEDGISIDKKIEILLSSDTPTAISKSMGLAMISFSEYFEELLPDALIVLGDRYETLAVCCAAMNSRIPIIHIHGGETTEGALDEAIRHSITKMSFLHFASTQEYRRRIIQMGENPERVFCVGAIGVENAINADLIEKEEIEKRLGVKLGSNYAVGTFHPVTLENCTAEKQVQELLRAIELHDDIFFLFTKANADTNGRIINKMLQDYSINHKNLFLVDSLGYKGYFSVVSQARFVIGNSSSGLIEVPSFHIPTIDIGDRQKGRIAGETVIHCEPDFTSIDKAIKKAEEDSFRQKILNSPNPYGNGNTSEQIVSVVKKYIFEGLLDLKKKFYDITFEV